MHSFMQKLPLALIAAFAFAGAASAQSSNTSAMSNDHMATGAMSSGAMSSGAMSTDHMTAPAKAKPKVKPMHKAGAMAANHSGLQRETLRNLLLAWVLTLPVCIFLGAMLFAGGLLLVSRVFGVG